MLKSIDMMQQHDSHTLIQEEQRRFNRSKREEVVPRYKNVSPPYYKKGEENENFEQRAQNFEPLIHYVVEQEVPTQGIKISRGGESVFVTRQEI
jgi:hypothetical protein